MCQTKKQEAQAFLPDLTEYQKLLLLKGATYAEISALLKEYAGIWRGEQKAVCSISCTALPEKWVCLTVSGLEQLPPELSLWHYQNLLLWLSQKSQEEFCLALPHAPQQPLFFSRKDRRNYAGDSCVGIYADRNFYFEVPGSRIEWGPLPAAGFDYNGFLAHAIGFHIQWLAQAERPEEEKIPLVLPW